MGKFRLMAGIKLISLFFLPEKESNFCPGFCEWLSANKYGAKGSIALGKSGGMPQKILKY